MSRYRIAFVLVTAVCLAACRGDDKGLASTSQRVFGTIPAATTPDRPELVALGRHLYASNELSLNRTQSCASCHPVEGRSPGADSLAVSK
ncbi:MAG: cytochrome c peroxidase, partial [Thermoanaerobaculia bacterium]